MAWTVSADGSHAQVTQPQIDSRPSGQTKKDANGACCVVVPSALGSTAARSSTSSTADSKSLIRWSEDIDKGFAQSLQLNKPMFLEFWASWCDPCKAVDKEDFADPQIAAIISEKFVPVRIDFDRNMKLDRRYGVSNLPTIALTDSYGTELFRSIGFVQGSTLKKILAEFPSDVGHINAFDRALTANHDDLKALKGLAGELQRDRLYRLSNANYDRALAIDKNHGDKGVLLAGKGFNYIGLKDPEEAIKIFEACLTDFPMSPSKSLFMLGLGRAYAAAGNRAKARQTLNAVIAEFPNEDVARKARMVLKDL